MSNREWRKNQTGFGETSSIILGQVDDPCPGVALPMALVAIVGGVVMAWANNVLDPTAGSLRRCPAPFCADINWFS